MAKARGILAAVRAEFTDQCFYCGRVGSFDFDPDGHGWQLDHIYPVVRGGENRLYNLALTCSLCNVRKWALTPDEFLEWTHGKGRRLALWWYERPTERPPGHPDSCRCSVCTYVALQSRPIPKLLPRPGI